MVHLDKVVLRFVFCCAYSYTESLQVFFCVCEHGLSFKYFFEGMDTSLLGHFTGTLGQHLSSRIKMPTKSRNEGENFYFRIMTGWQVEWWGNRNKRNYLLQWHPFHWHTHISSIVMAEMEFPLTRPFWFFLFPLFSNTDQFLLKNVLRLKFSLFDINPKVNCLQSLRQIVIVLMSASPSVQAYSSSQFSF